MRSNRIRLTILLAVVVLLAAGTAGAAARSPLMGESEKAYVLAPENTEVRGLAFDETSPLAPRLFVLDAAGKVFIYGVPPDAAAGELKLLGTHRAALARRTAPPSKARAGSLTAATTTRTFSMS